MAINTPKRMRCTELRPSPRVPLAVNSELPAVVEPEMERFLKRVILDTIPYGIESYVRNRGSTTTTIARTRGARSKNTRKIE
jgi:hypothetical protein